MRYARFYRVTFCGNIEYLFKGLPRDVRTQQQDDLPLRGCESLSLVVELESSLHSEIENLKHFENVGTFKILKLF